MASSPSFLARADALHRNGIVFPFEVGRCVARGYADLGVEEFILTGANTIVSLFTGKSSELPLDHEKHFFRIPTIDELVEEISRRGVRIESIRFVDQREWQGDFIGKDVAGECSTMREPSLEELLMEALLRIIAAESKDRDAGETSTGKALAPGGRLRVQYG